MPIPPKYLRLKRCPVCGEWRNPRRRILRLCDGYVCRECGEGRLHRPIGNRFSERDGRIWHVPYFYGWKRCDECEAAHTWVPASEAAA
jgi:hypothetical protein